MDFPAHIRLEVMGRTVQTVETHCRHCAAYAAAAAPRGMGQTAFLAGLLHDCGKYTAVFKDYITRAAAGEPVRRGSVNHTFAGVRLAMERWHHGADPFRRLTCEIIAFAVGSHHGQFDCIAPDGTDGYLHRLTDGRIYYGEAKENFLLHCAGDEELDKLFESAACEVTAALERLKSLTENQEELLFHLALLARQILSAVIEGDRRDTAEFMNGGLFAVAPAPNWRALLSHVEARLLALPASKPIEQARRRISDCCRSAADLEDGVYRLNVPTGGGKTLTTLRYALAAAAGGKRRVLFVIPLLSVLEQNAKVIRDFLGNDGLILEHHSNLVQDIPTDGELESSELLMETWDAPVIVTTLVQLLNTLLLGKPSCIRRMHALTDSIIVIDEVQSVPRNLLGEFDLAVNFLTGFCGAKVVLCSATQPCLEAVSHPLRYAPSPDLVPYDPKLWEVFRRTRIIDRRKPSFTVEGLADFAAKQAGEAGSLLLICNKKQEAAELFQALKTRWNGELFHLSTSMCMAHRICALEKINAALEGNVPVLCVSTQLVEAGVDFSFGCVIRVCAGMDNLVQSAGRCNRGGEHGRLCPVYVVTLQGENLSHLREIDQAQKAAQSVLLRYERDPAAFGNDLAGAEAISAYYHSLYDEMPRGAQDFPLPEPIGTTLFDLLSVNAKARPHCPAGGQYTLGQAFCTAGEQFHVFDDNSTDVLVPYGDGAGLIVDLGSEQAKYDLMLRKELLQKAKRFTVSLFSYQLKKLEERGGVYSLCEGLVLALAPQFYSSELGVVLEGGIITLSEV